MAIDAKFTADFSDFQKETQKATAGVKQMEDAVGKLARNMATDLLAMFSIRSAVTFVSDITQAASALTVLSNQTQISGLEIQTMAAAMSDFGIGTDEIAKGMLKLSRGIAGGDESVATALARMGLSLKDVQDLKGEALFLKIEHALGTLKGELRDTTAATLFGDKLGAAFAQAAPGVDAAMAKVKEFNTFMDDDARKALADYDTAMKDAWTHIKNYVANAMGPLAQGFNVLNEATQRGISLGTQAKAFIGWGDGVAQLANELAGLRENTEAQTNAVNGQAAATAALGREMTAEQQASQFLRTLRKNSAEELTEANIRHLEELKRLGQLNAENAAGVGVTAAQYKKYVQGLEDAKKAASDLAAAQREADALALTSYRAQIENLKTVTTERMKAYGTTEQIRMLKELEAAEVALTRRVYEQITSEKERRALLEEINKRREDIAKQTAALQKQETDRIAQGLLSEVQAHQQRMEMQGLDYNGYVKVDTALTTLETKLAALAAEEAAGIPTKERVALLMAQFAQANYDAARATDQVIDKNHQAAKSFEELAAAMRKEAAERQASRPAGLMPNAIVGRNGVALDMFGRPVVAGGGISQLPVVNISVDGHIIGTEAELARLIGNAMTGNYSKGGNRLPV